MSPQRRHLTERRERSVRFGRRRARTPLVLLLVALLLATPMAAWATWSSQDTLHTQASAGIIPPPADIACEDRPGGLLGLASHVRITWTVEPGSPEPTAYLIEAQTMAGDLIDTDTLPGSTRQIDIGGSVLTELLSGLLNLLLGGEREAQLRVSAVHEFSDSHPGWQSEPTEFVVVESYRPLNLLPLGVRCA